MLRVLLCLLILCAACAPPTVSGEVAAPSTGIVLAQAPQGDAPALVATGSGLVAAWIGSDERGVHQDARRYSAEGLSAILTLPLPPTHPYNQRLVPGAGNNTHLLWLDAGEDTTTNLFAALLNPDLSVERGPVSVSDGLALDYAAVSDGAGGLWAAWSGGTLGEMTLFMRRVDDEGRPLVQTTTIDTDAEHPALVRANDGTVWLFWTARGELMRQRLDPSGEAKALTGVVSIAPGDRLINVSAALDSLSAYFFWNITRADETSETWFAAGSLTARAWHQPERLRIDLESAPAGHFQLRWTTPLAGQSATLAAVTESDAGLSLVEFSQGALIGYRTVVPGIHLIGLPSVAADQQGKRYVAWSAPGDETATLRLLPVDP